MIGILDSSASSVLIETYWNVNDQVVSINRKSTGINRNILECKYVTSINALERKSVLIETYWNVNLFYLTNCFNERFSINRNILECK